MVRLALFLFLQERLQRGSERIEIVRDSYGVPHIFADTFQGAYYAEGWAEGHDRLWQMELWRRGARGTLAEIKGAGALKADMLARLRGYTRAEYTEMVQEMSERARQALAAYAEGVNAAIRDREDKRTLPVGFGGLPWTPEDSLSLIAMMARRFGAGGETSSVVERILPVLEAKHGKELARKMLDDVLRPDDPASTTTLDGAPLPPGVREDEPPPAIPQKQCKIEPRGGYLEYEELVREAVRYWNSLGIPTYSGSNAWVVSGARIRSGRPLLYGGPMMGQGTPSIVNEVSYSTKDLQAAGMSFPGLPGVLIGFNSSLAWTTTSGSSPNTDIFVLELDPENPERYRYKGGWKEFETREEEFRILGAEPRREKFRRSVYGPVISLAQRTARAVAASYWKREGSTGEAFLDFSFASNLEEFARSLPKITTNHNVLYADALGTIGYWHCGRIPIRHPDQDPRFAAPGDGTRDWQGWLPFDRLPHAVNPPCGYLVNWNNRPSRKWAPFYQGEIFWGKKIEDELRANPSLTFERSWEIAKKTANHAFTADYFLPYVLRATAGVPDGPIARARDALAGWDHMYREHDVASALWPVAEETVVRRAFRDVVPEFAWLADRNLYRYLGDPLLYRLEGDQSAFRLHYKYFDDPDAVLREGLAAAVARLEKKEKDWTKWSWTPERINLGPAGSFASSRERGTYMIQVELSPGSMRAESAWAPGISEDPSSPHFKDEVDLYARWGHKPIGYTREDAAR